MVPEGGGGMSRGLSVSLNKQEEGFHLISENFGEKLNYNVENAWMKKELALTRKYLPGK